MRLGKVSLFILVSQLYLIIAKLLTGPRKHLFFGILMCRIGDYSHGY